ncbi:redoxin domain-containing protein [Haloferula chungangensis]|uniref:Redoxin domain-containing protein n=1 Tax=Haloferula chungangensis TaxID=1048331 RepID=A0ABW2L6B1_9BACT
MKKIHLILAFLLSATALLSVQAAPGIPGLNTLAIGDAAPDFDLKGTDGKQHQLADYESAKILVIVFISNHCPDAQAAEGRLKKLVTDYSPRGVALVAINPNSPEGLRADELGYSKYNDSYEEMILHAKEQEFNFPYLNDGDTQKTAKAYGCLATPHVFVFDGDRRLQYKGELDDSRFADPKTVKRAAARDAIEALLAGKPVPLAETRPHGCSTKWLEKKANVGKEIAQWKNKPVEIETIDAAGVAKLRKNGTRKLRLFNIWSTSCAPCVQEFPELVQTARKFGMRQFELITISLDHPQDIGKAKAFLEKQNASLPDRLKGSLEAEGRTTNNYLYSAASQDELAKALDPEWPGPIPYSVLVAPDGSIVWRHSGMVDGDELRTKILSILGRYYQP